MDKNALGKFDMPTEPYPQILTDKEKAVFFIWVAIHNAMCVMKKAEDLSQEGRIYLLEAFRKQLSDNA